jgi:protein-S-isoprenylcysteine O-methyltransferase Ste14
MDCVLRLLDLGCAQAETRAKAGAAVRASASCRLHGVRVRFALCGGSTLGVLNRRFLPERGWIAMLGAVLTAAGVAFAIWARRHIGKNWSAQVTIRQEHELIRSGPYARIRHPIYTGLLLAVAGTAIAIGEYRAIVAFAVIAIGFVVKAKREEAFLATQFGPAFDEHRRQTGFFLPR